MYYVDFTISLVSIETRSLFYAIIILAAGLTANKIMEDKIMMNVECETLFLKIRALAHALDNIITDDQRGCAAEDANALSLMLVQLIDQFDELRTQD